MCNTCIDISNYVVTSYDNITYAEVVESDGRYVVAIMTKPFFKMSDKVEFSNKLKGQIVNKFDISSSNVRITYDIDIIYNMKYAKTAKDIKNIVDKVYD